MNSGKTDGEYCMAVAQLKGSSLSFSHSIPGKQRGQKRDFGEMKMMEWEGKDDSSMRMFRKGFGSMVGVRFQRVA